MPKFMEINFTCQEYYMIGTLDFDKVNLLI
jgi:hypothetical protein